VSVDIDRGENELPVKLSLPRLVLDDEQDQGPLNVNGFGVLQGIDFLIEGHAGSLADLRQGSQPYPLELRLASALNLSITGTVDDLPEGRGIDLVLDVAAPDLTHVVSLFERNVPPLGELHGHAHLRGSLADLTARDLRVTVSRHDEGVALEAKGLVQDLTGNVSPDVRFSAGLADPLVAFWLLPDDLPLVQALSLTGALQESDGITVLNELVGHVVSVDGLTVDIDGTAGFARDTEGLRLANLNIPIRYAAPTTAAAKVFLFDELPELGAVAGRMRFAFAAENMSYEDIDVHVGKEGPMQLTMRGRVGQVHVESDVPDSQFAIDFDISAAEGATLAALFERPIPKVGPLQARFRFEGSEPAPVIKNFNARVGTSERVLVTASGGFALSQVDDALQVKESGIDVQGFAATTEALGPWLGRPVPDLGPAKVQFRLTGGGENFGIADAAVSVGDPRSIVITGGGAAGQILLEPSPGVRKVDFDLVAIAPSTKALSPIVGFDFPDFGPLRASADVNDADGSLGLENINVRLGAKDNPALKASGDIDDVLKAKGINLKVEFSFPSESLFAPVSARPSAQLAPLQGELAVSDDDGTLGVERLDFVSRSPGLLDLEGHGSFDDLKARDALDVQTKLVLPDMAKLGALFDRELAALGSFEATGRLAGSDESARFQGDIAIGKTKVVAELEGSFAGKKPRLEGKITTPVLHLHDVGIRPAASAPADSPPKAIRPAEPVFSREPIRFDLLNEFDLALTVAAEEVVGSELNIDSLEAKVMLEDGVLRLQPARLLFEGGTLAAEGEVNARETPQLELKVTGDNVRIGRTLAQVQQAVPVEGELHILVALESTGDSPHAIASNLNGKIAAAIENGSIPRRIANLLAVDLFGWAISSTGMRERSAKIDCTVIRFGIEQGVATSEALYFDSPHLTAHGRATVDLGKETMDLVLLPTRKGRFFGTTNPVKVHGPLRSPSVDAISAATVARGTAGAAGDVAGTVFAPFVYVPARVLGELWGRVGEKDRKDTPCLQGREPTE
jgi:hypothetical protein